jgi:SAM-dependent methyltransferase
VTPEDLELDEQEAFFDRALSRPPARLLDAGCGRGALTARLAARGYVLTGVDIDADEAAAARDRGLDAQAIDFLSFDGGPFDVVLFSRSLHHMAPLDGAVQRAHDLLVPGGMLVCDEFAWEWADSATAAWYYDRLSELQKGGLIAVKREIPSHPDPLERWRHQLEHDPPLHRGEEMRRAIEALFELRIVETAPYLSFYLGGWVEETERGERAVREFLAAERRGIDKGKLEATGLRLVAHRPA